MADADLEITRLLMLTLVLLSSGLYDDLAVLRLNKTVELRAEVRPACLHSHDDEDLDQLVGVNATVAGWGRTQDGKGN
jgi:hypothetical protein